MRSYSFEKDGISFVRISKTRAKKLFASGKRIYACACNLRPEISMVPVAEKEDLFEQFENAFCFYNCTNAETGKYPAYYARTADVES